MVWGLLAVKRWPQLLPAAVLTLGLSVAGHAKGAVYDLLIRGGTVYDGSGGAPQVGDVAVQNGRIAALGAVDVHAQARRVIDARGLAVAPGFIDAHSHALEDLATRPGPYLSPENISQGVTTLLIGPDGRFSAAELRRMLVTLHKRGSALNYACYVGHNGIRASVAAGLRQPADAPVIARMAASVREGMVLGCVGLSTGLMYEPGLWSSTDEVIELAREVKPFDGIYDSHTRNPGLEMVRSEQEAIDIGRRAGVPVKLAHLKATGLVNRGRIGDVIAIVETARGRGEEVVADQYPYDGAAVLPLPELFVSPTSDALPVARTPRAAALVSALRDPQRAAAIARATEGMDTKGFTWVKSVGWGNMRIVSAPKNEALIDQNIELLAKARGVSPFELVRLLMLAPGGADIVLTMGTIDETDLRALIVKPWVIIASDGSYITPTTLASGRAHPRSTGSFTRILRRYVRETQILGLAEAIRKMTSLPADHLRLADRGRLAPGQVADIVIFDPERVADRSTYADPGALSVGVTATIVAGTVVWEHGMATGAVPGRFVPRRNVLPQP